MMMIWWESVHHKTEWQWHCVLRNYSSALNILYIAFPTYVLYQAGQQRIGKDRDGQRSTLGRPAGSHTSQLTLTTGSRASDETGYFYTNICDWERQSHFSIPGNTVHTLMKEEWKLCHHCWTNTQRKGKRPKGRAGCNFHCQFESPFSVDPLTNGSMRIFIF